MLVLDATPLIYLGSVDQLSLLESISPRNVVPDAVYEEVVVVGLQQGHADARRVERAVDTGILERLSVDEEAIERYATNPRLSLADASVLAGAKTHDAIAIVDDRFSRDVATVDDIETRGTPWIVLKALDMGTLAADSGREIIDAMIDEGWYCSTDLYVAILRTIETYAG